VIRLITGAPGEREQEDFAASVASVLTWPPTWLQRRRRWCARALVRALAGDALTDRNPARRKPGRMRPFWAFAARAPSGTTRRVGCGRFGVFCGRRPGSARPGDGGEARAESGQRGAHDHFLGRRESGEGLARIRRIVDFVLLTAKF
jgi:hypothetical protein